MSKTMLEELPLHYDRFYKIVGKKAMSSVRVAEKCGFSVVSDATETRWLHTIRRTDKAGRYLDCYPAKKEACEEQK